MSGVSYASVEPLVRERLTESGLRHCQAVAETAALLASVYGVDPETARIAGLLHDWDREVAEGELPAEAAEAGLAVGDIDREVPYLLHARTGAARLAQAVPGLPLEVVQAVARHTVGAPDMTDLDMIVYIADMIAPGRRFRGVEELRSLPGTVSLGDLFALCYQQSVGHLVRERKHIHPDTVAVWNALVAREQR